MRRKIRRSGRVGRGPSSPTNRTPARDQTSTPSRRCPRPRVATAPRPWLEPDLEERPRARGRGPVPQVDGIDLSADRNLVQAGRPDQDVQESCVHAGRPVAEVQRRVHVGPRVRAQAGPGDVGAAPRSAIEGTRPNDDLGVALVDGHTGMDRPRDVEELHRSGSSLATRRPGILGQRRSGLRRSPNCRVAQSPVQASPAGMGRTLYPASMPPST